MALKTEWIGISGDEAQDIVEDRWTMKLCGFRL